MKTMKLIFFAITFSISGCSLRMQHFNTYFWTSNSEKQCHLYIDNEDKGMLPYLSVQPRCGSFHLKQRTLHLQLASGRYHVEVKDLNGSLQYAEELTIERSNGSSTISASTDFHGAGARGTNHEDCMIREIYY